MEEKHKIDELFEQNFRDFEAETPEDNWGYISDRIDRRKRRMRMAALRWVSTAAAIVLAFFVGSYFNNDSISNPDTINIPQQEQQGGSSDFAIDEIQSQSTKTSDDSGPAPVSETVNKADKANKPVANSALATTSGSGQPSTSVALEKNGETPVTLAVIDPDLLIVPDVPLENEKALTLSNGAIDSSAFLAFDQKLNKDSIEAYTTELMVNHNRGKLKKNQKQNNYALSLKGGPALSFKNVQLADDNALANQNIENEIVNNSYTVGMELAYNSNDSWEFSAGMYYNYYRQTNSGLLLDFSKTTSGVTTSNSTQGAGFTSGSQVSVDLLTDGSNIVVNNNNGNPSSGNPSSRSFILIPDLEQTYQFVDLPLKAAYKITRGKLVLKAQTGLNARLLTQSELNFVKDDGSKIFYGEGNIAPLSFQLVGGPGLNWHITRKFNFQLDPLFYYSITPVDQSEELNSFWHQFMVFSGFSYRF